MSSLADIIIDKYRAQDEVAKAQNRELSKQFHSIFHDTSERGRLRREISKDKEKSVPGFWSKWEQLQERD